VVFFYPAFQAKRRVNNCLNWRFFNMVKFFVKIWQKIRETITFFSYFVLIGEKEWKSIVQKLNIAQLIDLFKKKYK
jgi:hypothetical protein